MKIIVVGAGMGGLCAGIALRQIGHDVEIFEKVREIRPVGAALSLWSNGVQCLAHLGLGPQVAALGGRMDRMAYLDGHDGTQMTGFGLTALYDRAGHRAYPVARAELQAMLMREFGPEHLHLGQELVAIEQTDAAVTARFADGSLARGDLLIGADGAHSAVRAHVLGRDLLRRYAGYVNWNGLIEADPAIAPSDQWTTFVAEGKRASLMPVAGGRFYFFFDVPLPPGPAPGRESLRDDLKAHFTGWAPPVQALIDRIDPARTNRVEIRDIDPFDDWVRGRVALLGDAAHNTTPDLGQGGCMAMEDAVVLQMELRDRPDQPGAALTRYRDRRAPRTAALVQRARRRCDITHAKDPAATEDWYAELRREDGSRIIAGLRLTIEGSPLDEPAREI